MSGEEPVQLRCPRCGQTDRLFISVRTLASVDARDLSADVPHGDVEWDDDSRALCGWSNPVCDWTGTVADLYRAAGILIPEDDGPPARG